MTRQQSHNSLSPPPHAVWGLDNLVFEAGQDRDGLIQEFLLGGEIGSEGVVMQISICGNPEK